MNSFDFTSVDTDASFEEAALKLFQHQSLYNDVYREYLQLLKCDPVKIKSINEIPFLPVNFFRTHRVVTGQFDEEIIFTSSGTTGQVTSTHFVKSTEDYKKSFLTCFEEFYGNPAEYCILALLPAYLERNGSSLVFMADELIRRSNHPDSGFYLDRYKDLQDVLNALRDRKEKVILLGVSFALMDMAESFAVDFPSLIVMETGGMKGRRKEIIREELHHILCKGFGVKKIHSEYGMTELLSQAYSEGDGIYKSPPWMRILIRDINDPFSLLPNGETGGVNIIDLANANSCAFIAVQDLGKVYDDHSFEILGRYDFSDLRGCNLMVS